jgi:hypothetical protein
MPERKITPPCDIFGRPYTRETYLWWRSLGEAQREQLLWERKRPDWGTEGIEELLKEYARTQKHTT